MLRTRVITALIGIPLLIGILYAGEMFRMGFFSLLALVGLYEFIGMMKQAGRPAPVLPALLLVMAFLLVEVVAYPLTTLVFITLLLAVFRVVTNYPNTSFDNTAMVAALIDRLTFKSFVLDMNGDSYRLEQTLRQ